MAKSNWSRRGTPAAVSTLFAIGTGALTNLATSSWTWPLGGGLLAMAAAWIVIEVWRANKQPDQLSNSEERRDISTSKMPEGAPGDPIASASTEAIASRAGRRREIGRKIDLLAAAILKLINGGRDEFFILEIDGIEGFYAQFMRSEDGVWAELVSSQFLAPWRRLSPEQEAQLAASGWSSPGDQSPNFFQDFEIRSANSESCARDLARVTFDTLLHVYGISEEDPISIQFSV
ncbi:TY-Chap domain-containing protein [Micromonospora echinospora]|uniref:TY-Chap domain-containing protein n=1 Tax=Micromonospora echinospora TaxID=1877 RepID=UPI003A84E29C